MPDDTNTPPPFAVFSLELDVPAGPGSGRAPVVARVYETHTMMSSSGRACESDLHHVLSAPAGHIVYLLHLYKSANVSQQGLGHSPTRRGQLRRWSRLRADEV